MKIYHNFHFNKVVQLVPLWWSESANKFLKFRKHHIRDSCCCYWQKSKKGISLVLEIPVDHFFHGDNGVIEWFKKSVEKLDKCTNVKVDKFTVYFPNILKITYFFYCLLIYHKMSVSAIDR